MPYIHLTRERKMLIALLSLLLALQPLLYLATVGETALKESKADIGYGVTIIKSIYVNSVLLLSVILAMLPYAIVDHLNRRYLDSVDRSLAPFFKGLAEAIRAGMPFLKALESVSRVTAGPLGREMERVVVRVELGSSIEEALRDLAERLNIPSIRRAVTIMLTAHESGGKVVDVLDTAAEMQALLRAYEEERRTQVAPYAWIVYMATSLFLALSFILIFAFLEPLSVLAGGAGRIPISKVDIDTYKAILFITSALQALLGGLIVGKLRSGSVYAGFIHSIILSLAVIAFFNFIEIYGPEIGGAIFPVPTKTQVLPAP